MRSRFAPWLAAALAGGLLAAAAFGQQLNGAGTAYVNGAEPVAAVASVSVNGLRSAFVNGQSGAGDSGAIVDGPPLYLLRDLFYAGSAASPRTCTPGPGTLTAIDTATHLSVGGGALACDGGGGAVWGDPMFRGPAHARTAGRATRFALSTSPGANYMQLGISASATPNAWNSGEPSFYLHDNLLTTVSTGITPEFTLGVAAVGDYVIVERAAGAFLLQSGVLVWVHTTGSTATVYPYAMSFNAAFAVTKMQVFDVPSWSSDALVYTSQLTTPAANATATMTPDALVDLAVTLPSAGTLSYAVRRTDDNNCLRLDVGATGAGNAVLKSIASGTPTTLVTGTLTARAVVVVDGTAVKLYCDNVLSGTGTDSLYGANTSTKVIGLGTGGAIATATQWPRRPGFPNLP